jgi:hypothetical protein
LTSEHLTVVSWLLLMHQVSVMDSELAENQAVLGGAIHAFGGCSLALHNSSFAHNNASSGGGLIADEISEISLKACMFEGNTAVGGGALHAMGQAQVGSTVGHADIAFGRIILSQTYTQIWR